MAVLEVITSSRRPAAWKIWIFCATKMVILPDKDVDFLRKIMISSTRIVFFSQQIWESAPYVRDLIQPTIYDDA